MRINLLIAFIVSIFLCSKAVDFASFYTPKNIYWIYIIPALFLLVAILYKKVGFLKATVSRIFIILFTIVPYLALMLYILLCIVNYPPEGTFEPKLVQEVVSEQEINAGKQLDSLLEEYYNKIDSEERELVSKFEINDSNKSKIIDLLNKTSTYRKEIFEYISQNSIAIPTTIDTTSRYYFLSEVNSDADKYTTNFLVLPSVFKLELLEVEMLRTEQKYDEAVEKYISLWNKLDDAYRVKNTFVIDVLYLVGITKNLGEYFYNNQSFFKSYDLTAVKNLKDDIIENLDRTYRTGFANEYAAYKANLENSTDIWPLMDKNRQLRRVNEIYHAIAEYERDPLMEVEYEEPLEFSKTTVFDLLRDYTGEALYAINSSMFSGLSANTIGKKNELSIYLYAMDKNNYQNIPKDYFTGEEFEVTDYPDRLEIISHTNARLEDPKKYVIVK